MRCSPPERIAVTYGGQPWVWTSPKRGPWSPRKATWSPREAAGCQPGLTIASYVAATNQVVAGTEVPPIQGEPGGRRLGRSPGALPFDSAAGAAGVYSGGYAEARLIGGALSTPGGARREGDLVEETGNPREDARARPEGKNRPIHRRRTNR